jgi:hypothetical protein
MTLKQINTLVKKHDKLSQKQKEELAQGILDNKKARNIAINGAISENNWTLAARLILGK